MDILKFVRGIVLILLFAFLFISCALSMQQGQTWLDAKTGPANLDLSGNWMCPEFSMAQLNQEGRNITGAFYSGGLIKGVVNADSVSFLVYDADTIVYMAELQSVDQKTLKGRYVPASSHLLNSKNWDEFARPIKLIKMPTQK
ncbi:MAG TPA: hypothetical protein DCZ95_12485 [Verrucomicrobia bacterium]|nr:hypothetical protein [Verrucomicrobiota bacterium]